MNESNNQTSSAYPSILANTKEVNLFAIWKILKNQKNVILLVFSVVSLLTIVYVIFARPIYKSETIFLPPSENDIQPLIIKNIQGADIGKIYGMFRENLGSIAIRRELFETMQLADAFEPNRGELRSSDEIFNKFNKELTLIIPNPKKGAFALPLTTLSLEERDPVLIANIVNRIAKKAKEVTKNELIADIDIKVSEQIKELKLEIRLLLDKVKKQRQDEIARLEASDILERNMLKDKIKALRKTAKDQRLDRITVLAEAISIAHTLGIKDPIDYKLKKISNMSKTSSQILTDISSKAPQLYTQGYEALEAKMASLKNRTNDDSFIDGLRGLEQQLELLNNNRKAEQLKARINDEPFIAELREKENTLAYLETIKINPETFEVASLEQAAFVPQMRVKPKRILIVILGLFLGLILGVLAAFIKNIIKSQEIYE